MRRLATVEQAAQWLRERVRGTLHSDSRSVQAGDGLLAWPGARHDPRHRVDQVLREGAAACLVEADGVEAFALEGDAVACFAGLKRQAGAVAAAWFGQPSQRMDVVAVTGTNGKTSTAWWIAHALAQVGRPCAVVGTLGVGLPDALAYTGLTTPDPVLLQRELARLADAGVTAVALEASSVGLVEGRLDGLRIPVAAFTNFTQDHLDYHGSMEAYWAAKTRLFAWPDLKAAVVNLDDPKGSELSAMAEGRVAELWTCAIDQPARLRAVGLHYARDGMGFDLCEGGQRHAVRSRIVGQYNVANLLTVAGCLRALGVPMADVARAFAALAPVPGRMEQLGGAGQPLVLVDYAHTPDALDKALSALRPLAAQRGGRLWCVFGCGGDRDPTKRPLMGAVAAHQADQVIVTSDNPRSERPESIISQILLGLVRQACVQVEADRAQAIARAVAMAGRDDVVLVAGKGHESWQEIDGTKLAFSDREHAGAALAARESLQ